MRIAFLFALVLVAACDTAGESEKSVIELGRLEFYNDPVIVEIPLAVMKGQQFQVRVETYGGGCIEYEDTEVLVASDGVDVFPYDRRKIPESGLCSLELTRIVHEANVIFDQVGPGTIRIHGRRVNSHYDEEIVITLTTTVE